MPTAITPSNSDPALGHSVDVNAQAYSDLSDLTTLYEAARARRREER